MTVPTLPDQNRQLVLTRRPEAVSLPDDTFDMRTVPVPLIAAGQVLVRVDWLSFDPTQRGWLNDVPSYLPPVALGAVMRAGAVGEVIASQHTDFAVGDVVQGAFGWQEYHLSDGRTELGRITKLAPGMEPRHALGVFGTTGLTAYFGMLDVCGGVSEGDVVVVSGAAGATGSVAGQIAKIKGASKVIGIAGGPEKCAWVVEQAGFDACIDYKSEHVTRRLRELCPKGINRYFDNVGGPTLDACLTNLAMRGKVVLCGGISSGYGADDLPPGPKNYMQLVIMRGRMEGFIVLDYAARFGAAVEELSAWMTAGKIVSEEDVQVGLEQAPATLRRLFEGKNLGKQLLRLS